MAEKPIADIIVSGYEWICPVCNTYHRIGSYPKNPVVICNECEQEIELSLLEDAID